MEKKTVTPITANVMRQNFFEYNFIRSLFLAHEQWGLNRREPGIAQSPGTGARNNSRKIFLLVFLNLSADNDLIYPYNVHAIAQQQSAPKQTKSETAHDTYKQCAMHNFLLTFFDIGW